MAVWRDIIESPDYHKLPLSEKIKTKNEFFRNIISKSEKFTSLAPVEQLKVRKQFFTKKAQEALEPNLPKRASLGEIAQYAVDEFQQKSPFKILDQPVEQLATMIEPKELDVKEGKVGEAKFLTQQMAAEVIRGYKPSTAGAFGVGVKALKPIAKPIFNRILKPSGQFIAKHTPEVVKEKVARPVRDLFLREFTVGKGQPKAYQEMVDEATLEKAVGTREAEQVAKTLTTKTVKQPSSKETKELLSIPEQRWVGRIFRKEVDLGGKLPRIDETPEMSQKIAKNVEAEVAFNSKIKSLKNELSQVNKALRDKETQAKGLIGKKFRTDTGFIEEATGIYKEPKIKGFDIGLKTEPVAPKPPTVSPIPENLLNQGENIVRSISQVKRMPTVNKFSNLTRQSLLNKRKDIARSLQDEIEKIEVGVRANYYLFNRKFSEQLRLHPKFQELSNIAEEGRLIMDKWSNELTKSGIPKKNIQEIIEKNIGEYMRRINKKYLVQNKPGLFNTKNLRLKLNSLKHRKILSETVANRIFIQEPALPTAISVKEISTSIANNKLFNAVSKNPEWTAENNITGDLIKMPDTPSLGALRGKYVIKEIAEDINAIVDTNKKINQGMYLRGLGIWKYGKIVLNPAAQFRNFLSNTILLDLSGVNHLKQVKLFPVAFKELISKGGVYQRALKDGAIGGEFVNTETIQRLRDIYTGVNGNNFEKFITMAFSPFKKAGDLYQGMEQLSKLVKYMDVLEKTGNSKFAAQEAQKWIFAYNKVPHFIDVIRKSPVGAPFITFTYKSIPRIAEAIINRPMTVYKYYAMTNAFNETSRKYQGMSPVEFSRQKKLLPPWVLKDIGGMPTNLLLPWKDKYGRTQWLNLEYILPVGQSPEILEKGLGGFVSNPIFTMASDIIKNTDFKGSSIVPPEATKAEAIEAISKYIYKQLAPNLAPGGYSFEKIRAGVSGEPEQFNQERQKQAIPVLLDTLLGIKINSLDVEEGEQFKQWNKEKRLKALKKEFYKINNNPILTEEEKEKRIEVIFQKQEKVNEE